jgi:hypothetical protein
MRISSSIAESNRVKYTMRPSRDALRPPPTMPRSRAIVVDRRVAKSKNRTHTHLVAATHGRERRRLDGRRVSADELEIIDSLLDHREVAIEHIAEHPHRHTAVQRHAPQWARSIPRLDVIKIASIERFERNRSRVGRDPDRAAARGRHLPNARFGALVLGEIDPTPISREGGHCAVRNIRRQDPRRAALCGDEEHVGPVARIAVECDQRRRETSAENLALKCPAPMSVGMPRPHRHTIWWPFGVQACATRIPWAHLAAGVDCTSP